MSKQKAPIPVGEELELEYEFDLNDGKYTVRKFVSRRWQALRYGEDWPACPYPSWSPNNMEAAAYEEISAHRFLAEMDE